MSQKDMTNEEFKEFLINASKRFKTLPGGGFQLQGYDKQKVDKVVEIILNNRSDWLKKFDREGYSRVRLKYDITWKILPKLNYNNRSIIKEFNEKMKNLLSNLPNKQLFHFIFPVNFNFFTGTNFSKKYKIKNTLLKILTYFEFQSSKFHTKKIGKKFNEVYKNKEFNSNFSFIKISHKSRDLQYSADKTFDIILTFLGLLNLSIYFNRISEVLIGNKIRPISKLKGTPYFFSYNSNKKYQTYFYTDNTDYQYFKKLNQREFDKFFELYKIINEIFQKNECKDIIQSVLKIYQKGVTETDVSSSFLKFWGALEIMTLKTKDMSHQYMLQRLKSIFGEDKIRERRLQDILKKRNNFVHKQNEEINENDLNSLKITCDHLLFFIIENCKVLNTRTKLEIMYNHGFKKLYELKDEKKILDKIIKNKSKNKK